MGIISFTPCSSSFMASHLSPISFKNESFPGKLVLGIWVSRENSIIYQNKRFDVRASNVLPLNAISLQAGESLISLLLI